MKNLLSLLLLVPSLLAAAPTEFSKSQLSDLFYCEGAAIGDLNRDGHADVVAGPFWFAGPDFKDKQEIYPPKPFNKNGYSDNFFAFTHDINGDGWLDLLVYGFPGKEAYWFANPQGKPGHWSRHLALPDVSNESPAWVDITGDGKPEIVCISQGKYGYAGPDWSAPEKPWTFKTVTTRGGGKFTHGLGVGDVNGDGRLDLLESGGWLEQPADAAAAEWTHHPVVFAEAGAQILVTDVDGDGDADVISAQHAHRYGLAWFEQKVADGKREFVRHGIMTDKSAESAGGVVFSQPHAMALADINGDGRLDLVVGKRHWAHNGKDPDETGAAVLYWYQAAVANGAVTWTPHLIDNDSGVGTQLTTGDLDGDGRVDIAIGNKKGIFVHRQGAAAAAPAAPVLFDGTSLNGWTTREPKYWSVENAEIVGKWGEKIPKNDFLISAAELADFRLVLEVRLKDNKGNSGVQFRSVPEGDSVRGFQADAGPGWWGKLYEEQGRALLVKTPNDDKIKPDGWNTYEIVAVGNRILTAINGHPCVDYTDDGTGLKSGRIALQLHSGVPTEVRFRNLQLELNPQPVLKTASAGSTAAPAATPATPAATPAAGKGPDGAPPRASGAAGRKPAGAALFGFEDGTLAGWTATGSAFRGQPVKGDTVSARRPSTPPRHAGQYWIGSYEIDNADSATGTLTSPPFVVHKPFASFLVGGGSGPDTRVELVEAESGKVVHTARGRNTETMHRESVDLTPWQGRSLFIRIVDEGIAGWGHINFDDFRLQEEAAVAAAVPTPPTVIAAAVPPRIGASPVLRGLVKNAQVTEGSASETANAMWVRPGFQVDVIAAEPQLTQPIAFTFDTRGRIWVVQAHSYPNRREKGLDSVIVLEDADNDGSFESRKVFVEGLNLVSGMEVGHGGVWIGAAPELLFIPDADGDAVPDGPARVILDGWGYKDTHETLNSFSWGPDGWLYGNQGVFTPSAVGRPGTPDQDRVNFNAGIWRLHPVTHAFEVYATGGSNQWGLDFNDHGHLFMTHCRSFWGKSPMSFVIRGGHYWRQSNKDYPSFVAGATGTWKRGTPQDDRFTNYLLGSGRYGHGEGGAGAKGTDGIYGGHSHVGTMIYLGDNWPSEYRDHMYTHNLHGAQMNRVVNERLGSGYRTRHSGADVLYVADKRFLGVDLQAGPDGAVYMTDWADTQHCHSGNNEIWNRTDGRLFRMRYTATWKPRKADMPALSDAELVDSLTHANEWHSRAAAMVLHERAQAGRLSTGVVDELYKRAAAPGAAPHRLRHLWALHRCGGLTPERTAALLADGDEAVRGWVIQLATDGADTAAAMAPRLAALTPQESSPLVRLALASAAQRLDAGPGWTILNNLARRSEDVEDDYLPNMIWFGLATFAGDRPADLLAIARETPMPLLADSITWMLSRQAAGRDLLTGELASTQTSADRKARMLQVMTESLKGQGNMVAPARWEEVSQLLAANPAYADAISALGSSFGSKAVLAQLRQVAADVKAPLPRRQEALTSLNQANDRESVDPYVAALQAPALREAALLGLGRFDSPENGRRIVAAMKSFPYPQQVKAANTLSASPAYALALMKAIQAGEIPENVISALQVRQMHKLQHPELTAILKKTWGEVNESPEALRAEMEKIRGYFKDAQPDWVPPTTKPLETFQRLCASCHMLNGAGGNIGPDLSGSAANGIEYFIESIVDPNSVIGTEYQLNIITRKDGSVVSGMVTEEASVLKVRSPAGEVIVPKDDVTNRQVMTQSMMPPGLLQSLKPVEVVDLLRFLTKPTGK